MAAQMDVNGAPLSDWLGNEEILDDIASADVHERLAATLDNPHTTLLAGDALPPLAHWLHFLPRARQSDIGADGHPKLGGFLPPVPLPRRMWAGSRLVFHAPLRVGESMWRRTAIAKIDAKAGRSGPLVFITLAHEVMTRRGLAVREEQDLVYRGATTAAAPVAAAPALPPLAYERVISPDPVLLFRFSALTFNAHRIHYDRAYATEVEGYPGLVVHGPLTATLLVDLIAKSLPEHRMARFTFRGLQPLFEGAPFRVCATALDATGRIELFAIDVEGRIAMQAEAQLIHEADL